MALTLEHVEHIADLAKLALTDEEKERFRLQLSAILDYAARLQQVPTDDIPPTANVLPLHTVLRADETRPGLSRDNLLDGAAEQESGMFRVDVILD
jgi:aspartyl-tRNA(Asn)/glutamyl-tRNA(Gln) amidotransferase subunit C